MLTPPSSSSTLIGIAEHLGLLYKLYTLTAMALWSCICPSRGGEVSLNMLILPSGWVGMGWMGVRAIESDALQYAGYHYDVHNLYGHTEGVATQTALHVRMGARGSGRLFRHSAGLLLLLRQ